MIPALALLTACGPLGDLGASSEADAHEARADAERALARAAKLDDAVTNLQGKLRLTRRRQAFLEDRMQRRSERLSESLGKLRAALGDLREANAATGEEASRAIALADKATRDLSVLTRRFDYHLRSGGHG